MNPALTGVSVRRSHVPRCRGADRHRISPNKAGITTSQIQRKEGCLLLDHADQVRRLSKIRLGVAEDRATL